MKIIKFIDKLLNFIMIIFFIIVIAFSGYALYDVHVVYEEAELSDDILKYKPKDYDLDENGEKFDLSDLQKEINEDICGWIRIDDTNIDYPIMFPKTSLEYLDKNYKKEFSPGGSIFIDYKNDRFFKDDYTLIYGHNMAENAMFSDIKKFSDLDFFENHKVGKLYTEDGVYNILIYSYNVLDSNNDIVYKLEQYKNGKNSKLIENCDKTSILKNDIEINENDKIIILSTCNGAGTPQRATLFCKLEKIDNSNTINEDTDSSIDRDERRKIQEQQEKERKRDSLRILRELLGKDSNLDNESIFDRIKDYLEYLWKNPQKLILYILIFITGIIYLLIFIKKIKKDKGQKKKGLDRIYDSKIESNNIRKIKRIVKKNNKGQLTFDEKNVKSNKDGKHSL